MHRHCSLRKVFTFFGQQRSDSKGNYNKPNRNKEKPELKKLLPGNKENSEKKPRRCFRRVFTGLFMLTSGIAMWLNLTSIQHMKTLNTDWQLVFQAIASTILILWIFAGFWLIAYGLFSPCPEPLEY